MGKSIDSFKYLRVKAGYTLDDCKTLFEVCDRTLKDWDNEKRKPPKAVFLCLKLFAGELDFLGKAWRGFRILPDCIESPDGEHIWHYEIKALRYLYQAAGLERYRIGRMLRSQSDSLTEYPPSDKQPVCLTVIKKAS